MRDTPLLVFLRSFSFYSWSVSRARPPQPLLCPARIGQAASCPCRGACPLGMDGLAGQREGKLHYLVCTPSPHPPHPLHSHFYSPVVSCCRWGGAPSLRQPGSRWVRQQHTFVCLCRPAGAVRRANFGDTFYMRSRGRRDGKKEEKERRWLVKGRTLKGEGVEAGRLKEGRM